MPEIGCEDDKEQIFSAILDTLDVLCNVIHYVKHVYIGRIWLIGQSGSFVNDWFKLLQSSSRMRVINHNWSATKQRLHPQSVAEISRYFVRGQYFTMRDIVWVTRTQISVCKSPFPSAATAVSVFSYCSEDWTYWTVESFRYCRYVIGIVTCV